MALRPAEPGGFLKASLYGDEGAGKTFLAMSLAIEARRRFGLDGPIAGYDTEGGLPDHSASVVAATGQSLLVESAHSLAALMSFVRECIETGVSVAVVDSLTHVWEGLTAGYLDQYNERQRRANKQEASKLQFQHWGPIKSLWRDWVTLFLNAPLHIIVCARRGITYDVTAGRNADVTPTGDKLKAEKFGHEARLLVRMERVEDFDPKRGTTGVYQEAVVLKDRLIDAQGKSMTGARKRMATGAWFGPHLDRLNPATHRQIDTAPQRHTFADGGASESQESIEREALGEEIKAALAARYPSQSAADKQARTALLERVWGTPSWTRITKGQPVDDMRRGLATLRAELSLDPADEVPEFGASGS